MDNSSEKNKSYTHVLQKVGILKNFSVAKIVSKKEMDDLKQLIRAVSKNEKEYNKLFEAEMAEIGNMHGSKEPIPGIVYYENDIKHQSRLIALIKECFIKVKSESKTKNDMCYVITSIIKELGLTQQDFLNLTKEIEDKKSESKKPPFDSSDDDDDDDDDDNREPI